MGLATNDKPAILSNRWPKPLIVAACLLVWPALTEVVRFGVGAEDFYGVPFALGAVLVASWAAGLLGGLTVAAFSVLLLSIVLPETRVVSAESESAWHILVFSVTAVFVSSFQASSNRLRERLRREQEYKDSFLSLMAHELRTPATIIHSGLRLLRLRGPQLSREQMMEVIEEGETESERLSLLIDDILILSQLQNGKHGFPGPLSLRDLLQTAIENFSIRHPAREIRSNLDEDDCPVAGQERHVAAVLRHLLLNSDAYSAPGTPIAVTLSRKGSEATVSVRDYGPRLNNGDLKLIFDPYYRGSTLSAGSRGLGLGLTLCKRVVESLGGRMTAHSPFDGGLEVSFTLQCIEIEAAVNS